jgi:hypothetical protein
MAYVGTPLDTTNAFQSLAGKRFNGDGSTTDFTLDSSPNSTLDIEVFVGNVRQDPNSAYTVSGTTLAFTGAPPSGTNNIYVVHQAKAVGTIDPAVGSTLDLNGAAELILDADGDTSITADTDDQIDIRINGADDFTFTGNSFNVLSGSEIDLADNCELRIGDSDDMRLFHQGSHSVIVHDGTGDLQIRATDSGKNFIVYDHDASNEWFRIDANGDIATGGETAPDVDAGGICIDTNANDANSLTFKNSDVGHPFTDIQQADTFLAIKKASGSSGGAQVEVFGEGVSSTIWVSHAVNANTTQSTSGRANFEIDTYVDSGTDRTGMSADHNIFMVKTGASAKFIVEGNGMLHSDGGAQSAYDAYDDAQLVRAFDLSHGKGTINSKFDKFIGYNHEKLAELGIVGREDDGTPNHFINITLLQRLHNGAIWQQYEKHNQLLDAVYDLAKEAVGEEKANAILDKHEVKRLQ